MTPFIVAELSANHNGSLDRAIETIDAAALAGADAVKFQTFNPAKMAVPGYTLSSSAWEGMDLVDLYMEAWTPFEWHEDLFEYARQRDLTPFSSPFDEESVELLESVDCPIYKIASFELIDLELIALVAKTGKPIIMSTGMAERYEIRAAVNTARNNGCTDLTLLHCISEYPARPEHMNLVTMRGLEQFNCRVGLSDHSLGSDIPIAATALGASVIEKHFTLSRKDGGLDSGFSMEPKEFARMAKSCRSVHKSLGRITFGQGSRDLRRSLYYSEDLQEGTILENHHIKTARPALGLSPLMLSHVLGKPLKKDVKANDPVQT